MRVEGFRIRGWAWRALEACSASFVYGLGFRVKIWHCRRALQGGLELLKKKNGRGDICSYVWGFQLEVGLSGWIGSAWCARLVASHAPLS